MSEQALDLRSAIAVVRRRARFVVAAGIVGLGAGVALGVTHPPQMRSTTLVLLPAPTPNESVDVATQVRIVMSADILGKAGQAVHPAIPYVSMLDHVMVSAPTDQIIEVDATATKGRDAQTLSEAVADAYVSYARQADTAVSSAALQDLNQRKTDLEAQLTSLQSEIQATTSRRDHEAVDSADGKKDAQLLAQLRGFQADISLQLDKVKGDIATRTSSADSSTNDQTSVVQAATAPRSGSIWFPLTLRGMLGFLAGMLLAAVWAVMRARRDPRARLRDEIADAVGSTVLGGVRSRAQKSVAGWATLLESYDAGPVDAWAYRQVLRQLVPAQDRSQPRKDARQLGRVDHPRSLTIVSLAGDQRALAVGPQLASFAASLGITTRLLTAAGNASAASLWAACTADRESDPRPGLVVGEVRPEEVADLTIVLAVADREKPQLGYALHTASTLLAVSPGTATQDELARLAVAVDDAGRFIDGIVIADPDSSDRTSGRHSLEERARQVALPMRLTGVRQDEPASSRWTGR